MTYNEAKKLQIGDIVYQKMHGYKLTVQMTKEFNSWIGGNKIINVYCTTENNNTMIHSHKELKLSK